CVSKVEGYLAGRSGEVVNEIRKIGEFYVAGVRVPAFINPDCAARVERHSVIHLQVVDVASEFEGMAPKCVRERFLELIRLVPPEVGECCGNSDTRQGRLVERYFGHVSERSR